MPREVRVRFFPIFLVIITVLAGCVIWPEVDLMVSGWFYQPETGFFWEYAALPVFVHDLAYYGARILGVMLAVGAGLALLRRKNVCGVSARAWLFLFLGLLIGPGLVANVILKDNWGRARPREVIEFGGQTRFTPPLMMANNCANNCSFVAGDAALGFYLPCFGYVVSTKRKRRVFWGGMALGVIFGVTRIVMGGHFMSDVLFAAFFMLLTTALLHMAMFGRTKTAESWRQWGFRF